MQGARNGLHRTDHHQSRQRRADHLPADRGRHRRREARVRARALSRRPRAGRARASRAGGALPRARGHDEVPDGPAADRRQAGDTVVVPAGRVHRFANGGDETARCRVEVVPALDMEQLLETTVELALEGNVTRKGMPKPLHLALFVRRFAREVRAPFPPAWLVRVADGAAGRAGRASRSRGALRHRVAPGLRKRSGTGLVPHPVFKTGRRLWPSRWQVRFLRRSARGIWLCAVVFRRLGRRACVRLRQRSHLPRAGPKAWRGCSA